jgi:hypothetical protein
MSERLSADEREALDAADSILSLLAHRGLIDSDMNREDVRQASDRLARLRPRGGTVADHFEAILAARLADQAAASERERAGWALYAEFVDRERRQTGWTIADQAARLAAVEALHRQRGTFPESCDHCGHRWPCPTRTALHPDPSEVAGT